MRDQPRLFLGTSDFSTGVNGAPPKKPCPETFDNENDSDQQKTLHLGDELNLLRIDFSEAASGGCI